MAHTHARFDPDDPDAPLITRPALQDDARFDITAMIDLVFMMNIFFLVTTITAGLSEMDLPVAKHCVAADRSNSVVISVAAGNDPSIGEVYIGDGKSGEPIIDIEEQIRAVRSAVEDGSRELKQIVLIKAEKEARLRVVGRVASAAAVVPGTDLRLSVIEKE